MKNQNQQNKKTDKTTTPQQGQATSSRSDKTEVVKSEEGKGNENLGIGPQTSPNDTGGQASGENKPNDAPPVAPETKSWEDYGKTEKPHFSDYKDWLAKWEELAHENINERRIYLCECCEGIYVNHLPMGACQGTKDGKVCGNDDMEQFKEITGEMRQFLLGGGSIKKILSYSYTFS